MDPTGITTAATGLLEAAATTGVVVLVAGLVLAGVWGWLTRGRGY